MIDLFQYYFYNSDYFSLISNFYSRISVPVTCAHHCDYLVNFDRVLLSGLEYQVIFRQTVHQGLANGSP